MKQKTKQTENSWRRLTNMPVLTIATLFTVSAGFIPSTLSVSADPFDDQIRSLQQQNSQSRNSLFSLQSQASSYQDAINKLQAQINAMQQLINENVAQQVAVQRQIDANQLELDRNRHVLGEDIKMMYVDGEPSTIEVLATSRNLSDFVDKEEYRSAVQTKIQDTLKRITELQRQLKDQKTQIDQLLTDQRAQQTQLDSDRVQQAQMLAYNEGQQNQYNQTIKANQSKIADLRRQQAIENAKLFGNGLVNVPDTTGYPWINAAFPSGGYDPWGMEYRQCVSYTAWKVWRETGYMYGWGNIGMGNANQWDDDARAAGIRVDNDPRGDVVVAIKNSQPYGHAVFVEHVYDNGDLYISQYNAMWDGRYSEARLSPGGWVFIHFR